MNIGPPNYRSSGAPDSRSTKCYAQVNRSRRLCKGITGFYPVTHDHGSTAIAEHFVTETEILEENLRSHR